MDASEPYTSEYFTDAPMNAENAMLTPTSASVESIAPGNVWYVSVFLLGYSYTPHISRNIIPPRITKRMWFHD